MIKVGCILESRMIPVQVAHVSVDIGIIMSDCSDVTLEMDDVDGIKANQGRI